MERSRLRGLTVEQLQRELASFDARAREYSEAGAPTAASLSRHWAAEYAREIRSRIAATIPAPAQEG